MKKFMIITNTGKDEGLELTNRIKKYIEDKGGSCVIKERGTTAGSNDKISADVAGPVDCALVLGGDGTIVRAARDMTGTPIPIIGVNLGSLGYLCDVDQDHVFDAVDRIMGDVFEIEDRVKLMGSIIMDGESISTHTALNDVVVYRAGNLQIVSLNVYINGQYLCNYNADGLIIATPTGSTAYSMSAGGPIVDPKAELMVLTPVNPQTTNARSIVISSRDEVSVEVMRRNRGNNRHDESVEIAFDGDNIARIHIGDRIVIRKAPEMSRFLKLSQVSFIDRLQKKIESYNDRGTR
ncbi:MAG: NAD(+)/NADH kinase [Eubacterium sp.]|nr:NAD(+)/NADH kinase [Eubacterium sp.]